MIEILIEVFVIGLLNRLADMHADEGLRMGKVTAYLLGATYGFLIAHLIVAYPVLAEAAIAVMVSVIVTGKINHTVHYAGVGVMLLSLAFYGIPPLIIPLLAAFLVAGIIDEMGNDLFDGKRGKKGVWGVFFERRMTMEVVALAVTLLTGNWVFIASVICYEIGYSYIFTKRLKRKLLSIGGQ